MDSAPIEITDVDTSKVVSRCQAAVVGKMTDEGPFDENGFRQCYNLAKSFYVGGTSPVLTRCWRHYDASSTKFTGKCTDYMSTAVQPSANAQVVPTPAQSNKQMPRVPRVIVPTGAGSVHTPNYPHVLRRPGAANRAHPSNSEPPPESRRYLRPGEPSSSSSAIAPRTSRPSLSNPPSRPSTAGPFTTRDRYKQAQREFLELQTSRFEGMLARFDEQIANRNTPRPSPSPRKPHGSSSGTQQPELEDLFLSLSFEEHKSIRAFYNRLVKCVTQANRYLTQTTHLPPRHSTIKIPQHSIPVTDTDCNRLLGTLEIAEYVLDLRLERLLKQNQNGDEFEYEE